MKASLRRAWNRLTRRVGQPWVVMAATIIIGVGFVAASWWLWVPDQISPYASDALRTLPSGMTGTVGDTSWQSVRLYQTSGPTPTILLSIGTGLLSAFLMHLVAEAVARNHKTREGQAFEQFFGEGALSRQ